MEEMLKFIPIILPIIFIHLILAIIALNHIIKHPKYRFGNKIMWILIVFLLQFIGPIIYFVVGKGEDE